MQLANFARLLSNLNVVKQKTHKPSGSFCSIGLHCGEEPVLSVMDTGIVKTLQTRIKICLLGLLMAMPVAVHAQTGQYLYTGTETNITLPPGTYIITAYGAQGGNTSVSGGLGAEMEGQFNFSALTTLTILVGGAGSNGAYTGGYGGGGGGGGGGSFVVEGGTPLVVSGGGGGGYSGGGGGEDDGNSPGGGSYIDSSAISNLVEISGIASPDDSPNGEVIISQVYLPPLITSQPTNVTATTGGTATFTVGIAGSPPFTYQWKINGTNISGATNATLSLANLSATNAAIYSLAVTNSTGGAVSAPIYLFLLDKKLITGLVATGPAGTNYDLQSTPALGGGSNWTVATNFYMTAQPFVYIDFSALTNQQKFFRLASTNAGPAPAALAIKMFPQLSVNVPVTGSYDFQSGSGGNWTTLTNISYTGQPFVYLDYAVATNSGLSYRIEPAPVFAVQPTNASAPTGGTATFTAVVSGTPPFTCQWTFNGTNIAGATNLSLTITNVSAADIGTYTLNILDGANTVTSSPATLTTVDVEKFALLLVIGTFGSDYTIQSTPALGSGANWTTLTNFNLQSASFTYIDFATPTNPQQFYRVTTTDTVDSPPTLTLNLIKTYVINGNN